MNDKKELKLLKKLLATYDKPKSELSKIRIFLWVCRITGIACIAMALTLLKSGIIIPALAIFIATVGGLIIGLSIYMKLSIEQWPVLSALLSREKMEARIHEIEI